MKARARARLGLRRLFRWCRRLCWQAGVVAADAFAQLRAYYDIIDLLDRLAGYCVELLAAESAGISRLLPRP